MHDQIAAGRPARRLWTFGRCSFDEARWLLRVGDRVVEIEAKPLDILLELLGRAGEVVTKEELLDAVWPGVTVVEGSLTTAISKLRKALGDPGGELVATAPRLGYRMAVPVTWSLVAGAAAEVLPFAPGMAVPERPNWRFAERLGLSSTGEVWRVEHGKTRESRVIKFAADAGRLRSLKREVAISRLLQQALGPRPDLVPILDWNFTAAPFFVESAFGGPTLGQWAEQQGGLASVPLADRLELLASIAVTVSAAHGVAVLHRDLKPANILVVQAAAGGWQARVVDFGSGVLSDPDRLASFGITRTGFEPAEGGEDPTSGTLLWMAPELLAGAAASVASDVYALGVMLYQMVVGDFRKPLSPGWEADVADPMLREDIALAAAGDPGRRLDSAAELARRLRALEARRVERQALDEAAARAAQAEARLQRIRARRPWAAAAAALLVLGVAATTTLYVGAAHDRDEARRQTAIAEQVSQFLGADLLALSSPFRSASADERLVDAVKQAAALIDRRFPGEPAVAARLHQTIANALDKRSDWPGGRTEYERAAALWTRAGGASSQDAVAVRLQQAMMEARSYEQGSLDRARRLIARQEAVLKSGPAPRADVAVWLASAKGMAALIDNDARGAERNFSVAVAGADRLAGFDPAARLTFRQRLAFAKIRLGDGAGAERLFRQLGRDFAGIEGPSGPNVLMVGMNLAQALMIQGRHAEAVAQADEVYPRMLARLGPEHEMTLQLVTTRAQSEGALERWDDAIRDDLRVHDIAVRKQGPRSFFAVATLSDAATAQCRGGRLAEGLKNAAEARRLALAGFGKAALTDAAAYGLAACQIAAGRYQAAAASLEGVDRAAVAQLAADPNWGANVDLALAQIADGLGRKAEVRHWLDAAAPAFRTGGADPYQVRAWRVLDRRFAPRS